MKALFANNAIDAIYEHFLSIPNAARVGERDALSQETFGDFLLRVESIFIPTIRSNEGILISRTQLKSKPLIGQVERGIAYTNISGLDAIVKNLTAINRMFTYHLNPPDGKRAGIVKAGGMLFHLPGNGTLSCINEFLVEKPQYGSKSPFKAISARVLGRPDPTLSSEVIKDAIYEHGVVSYTVSLIRNDLKTLPTYRV